MFNRIHEIVFHGNGGYDWFTVYNMPIWLRNFTWNQINDYYQKKNKREEEEAQKIKSTFNKKSVVPFTTKKGSK